MTHKKLKKDLVQAMKIKYLFLGLIFGLFISGLSFFILINMNKSREIRNKVEYHPATFAIVEKFLCGCPNCKMELKVCYCSDAKGGVYEMYYISEQLKQGLSEEQVIQNVYAKFGNIKDEYRYLVENNEQFLNNR